MTSQRSPQRRGASLRRIQGGLRRLTQHLHRLNDAVGSHLDLLPDDLEVLDLIGREGPISPRDVVARTGIHPATLTGMLDRLERGRWLARRPDPNDRRRVLIEAATHREREIALHYAPMTRAIGEICAGYNLRELELIADFLDQTANAGVEAAAEVRARPRE